MAQTKSIQRWRQRLSQNRVRGFSNDCVAWGKRLIKVISAALILLFWAATPAAGGSGAGLGIKVGAQTIESPIDLEKTTRARYELEVSSARSCNDHFDFALTFGGSSLGSFTDEYVDWDDGVLMEDTFTDDLYLLDLRLAARLYPFGSYDGVQPYVGAGIGYFWFRDSWEYEYSDTVEDPDFPGVFYTFTESEEGTDTVAKGFFAFVTAGLMVPVGPNFEMLFELQYDFDKQDSGFDFAGPAYMFGLRFRF
jgi:opacity protein-like surface antigen